MRRDRSGTRQRDGSRSPIAVMGGEDWQMWIAALLGRGFWNRVSDTAFTYLGDTTTHPIYGMVPLAPPRRISMSDRWHSGVAGATGWGRAYLGTQGRLSRKPARRSPSCPSNFTPVQGDEGCRPPRGMHRAGFIGCTGTVCMVRMSTPTARGGCARIVMNWTLRFRRRSASSGIR